jgi:hypothetical protein
MTNEEIDVMQIQVSTVFETAMNRVNESPDFEKLMGPAVAAMQMYQALALLEIAKRLEDKPK